MRDSFVYHLAWEEVMDNLPGEVREEVRNAIIGYARLGVTSELKPLAKVAFEFVRKDMDRDFQKYQETVSARSENGKRGAKARWDKPPADDVADEKMAKMANAIFANGKMAKMAEYDCDGVNDNVTQCVCDVSAQKRADTTTPHTDFDFFFPVFWKRNVWNPAEETRRFLDHYESAEWTLEKGTVLKTDVQRLAKARSWSPKKEGQRFPKSFMKPWLQLADIAPPEVRVEMLDDRVEVSMKDAAPRILCGRKTVEWLRGDGCPEFRRLIMVGWLENGPFNVNIRF